MKIKEFPLGIQQVQIYKNKVGVDIVNDNTVLDNYDDVIHDLNNYDSEYLNNRKKAIEKELIKRIKKKNNSFQYSDKEDNYRRSSTRCKQTLYDYARSNVWEWFATITFNSELFDRTDYDLLRKKLGKFLNNLKNRYCPNMKYLGVPELHKDGISWHFHLLLSNIDELTFIRAINGKIGSKYYGLPLIDNNGREVYVCDKFKKLGHCTFTRVSDTLKASNYITKYLTKQQDILLSGKRRIVKSNNLDKPTITTVTLSNDDINTLKNSLDGCYHNHKLIGKNTLYENELDIYESEV